MKISLLAYCYVCAALLVTGQWLWKIALRGVTLGNERQLGFWMKLIASPWMILGIFTYGVATVLWVVILKKFPLGVAYPVIAGFALLNSALVSRLFLGEPFTFFQSLGIVMLIGAVALISSSM